MNIIMMVKILVEVVSAHEINNSVISPTPYILRKIISLLK